MKEDLYKLTSSEELDKKVYYRAAILGPEVENIFVDASNLNMYFDHMEKDRKSFLKYREKLDEELKKLAKCLVNLNKKHL